MWNNDQAPVTQQARQKFTQQMDRRMLEMTNKGDAGTGRQKENIQKISFCIINTKWRHWYNQKKGGYKTGIT